MAFVLFITFIIVLRFGELLHSKRNEKWLLANGAVEYGQMHYPFMIALHTLFIISLIVEYSVIPSASFIPLFFVMYVLLIGFKTWVILSLGKFWNTKIYRIQNIPLIKKGPYKYLRHPNYLIVIGEIILIPLTFHLYCTALMFTLLNAMMLYVRIKVENRALGQMSK